MAEVIWLASENTIRVEPHQIQRCCAVDENGKPSGTGGIVNVKIVGSLVGEYQLERKELRRLAKVAEGNLLRKHHLSDVYSA